MIPIHLPLPQPLEYRYAHFEISHRLGSDCGSQLSCIAADCYSARVTRRASQHDSKRDRRFRLRGLRCLVEKEVGKVGVHGRGRKKRMDGGRDLGLEAGEGEIRAAGGEEEGGVDTTGDDHPFGEEQLDRG